MRGTGFQSPPLSAGWRFIPAHAGNRAHGRRLMVAGSVHPRACGEQFEEWPDEEIDLGSSPRMRGTDQPAISQAAVRRFIPAHAGNRSWIIVGPLHAVVHPRACGEQMWPRCGGAFCMTSSPRMRGTDAASSLYTSVRRFIPAHAGNRESPMAARIARAVHPRACGEQPFRKSISCSNLGSSPRMRGTDADRSHDTQGMRFIPAHAGNSPRLRPVIDRTPVHPRACGEQEPC